MTVDGQYDSESDKGDVKNKHEQESYIDNDEDDDDDDDDDW